LLTCYVYSTKIGEISDISKCFENFVSQALGVLTRIYAAELRDNKNLLLYGENGSGKSSIFEAIKLIFYRERLLYNIIPVGASEEQKKAEEENFYNSYINKSVNRGSIEIKVNDTDFNCFQAGDYQCYMLSHTDILPTRKSSSKAQIYGDLSPRIRNRDWKFIALLTPTLLTRRSTS